MLIHNYTIIEKLGQGAFSVVYKGKSVVSDKEVAIKVSKDPEQRLKHESKILAYLNRERVLNVPALYWYGTHGTYSCIATTLYSNALTPLTYTHQTLDCCNQIISGLCAIHCTGIVHSDIKPDNFMVDEHGAVKIIDFGLSTLIFNRDKGVMRENAKRENLVGSCKYASYNLHIGNSISFRDDMISAGYVMMWLHGIHLPWSKDSQLRTSRKGGPTDIDADDLPPYHIHHPENVERSIKKQYTNLINHIDNAHLKEPAVRLLGNFVNLTTYFKMVYSLKYEEIPKYADYAILFSTIF